MFDKVWNGEYNEYAVESRIIGVETRQIGNIAHQNILKF